VRQPAAVAPARELQRSTDLVGARTIAEQGGEDGTVRVWACTISGGVDELLALADARLALTGRTLTDEERARHLGK
jgi:hypothetical protein